MFKSYIELRPFQRQLLDELSLFPAVGIFSKTGSGKTIMAIQRFLESGQSNLLVLCPSHVVDQWKRVAVKTMDGGIIMMPPRRGISAGKLNEYIGSTIKKGSTRNIVILSLQSVHKMRSLLEIVDDTWMIVVDESHRIKSPLKKRRKDHNGVRKVMFNNVVHFSLELSVKTPFKLLLTATPTQGIKGGYIDLYTQFLFLGLIDMTLEHFKQKYVIERSINVPGLGFPIQKIVGYRDRVSELDELLQIFTRSYSPKYTEDEPTYEKVIIEKSKNYNRMVQQRYYEDLDFSNPMRFRMYQKTLTGGYITGFRIDNTRVGYEDNTLKIDYLEQMLSDTDEKVVIIYNYNAELYMLEKLMEKIDKKYITLKGGVQNKQELIENEEYDVILGQIKACGESLDGLQHKSHIMILYSMPDSSLDYRQVIGRIYRDGQTISPTYYFLVMEGTIDDHIYKMIESKVEFTTEMIDMIALEEFE